MNTPNAYDSVPYGSFPFAQTNPSLIRSIGSLFGVNAPAPANARILELGCAGGNNILAIAMRFPGAHCVGVDLSTTQIEQGKRNIAALGVENLTLETLSIADIREEFGQFDYIICHGVYSWVSKDLQKEILRVCSQNLAPNGIAYVSYNTLPGWSQIAAMREMMLYHTARFTNPAQKAEQARLLLKFLHDSTKEQGNRLYSDALEMEANILNTQSDWYLLHDHLEEHNIPCYFHEFMASAAEQGLQYLAETALHTMLSANLPAETAKVLATSDDIVRTEQYMDFIYNRRFRSTLLCHKDQQLNRQLNPQLMVDKSLTSHFALPDELKDYEIGSGKSLTFRTQQSLALTTDNPALITAIGILAEQKFRPLHMNKLCQMVIARVKEKGYKQSIDIDQLKELLAVQFLRSIFIGGISMHLDEDRFTTEPTDKQILFPLAAYQVSTQSWVTNLRQESVPVAPLDQVLMPLLDGTRTLSELEEALLPEFMNGTLNIAFEGKRISAEEEIRAQLPAVVRAALESYAVRALLVG